MRYLLALFILAGCHPKEGDVYIHNSTLEQVEVVGSDNCLAAAEQATRLNKRLAELAEQSFTPADVLGIPDNLDCIVYSSSEPLSQGGVAIGFEVMSVQFLESNYHRQP